MTRYLIITGFVSILQLFILPVRNAFAKNTTTTNLVINTTQYDKTKLSTKTGNTIKLIPGTPEYESYMNHEHLKNTINSQRAWIYSALVPGLGQVYNKQYIRAAVIWGALVTIGSGAYYCHNKYVKFHHENNTGSFVKTYRKVRDSLLFVGLLCYMANILDAYVGSELSTFDISDDVSVQIVPNIHKSAYNDTSAGVTLAFIMK